MGGINIPSGKMTMNPIRLHSFICAWVMVVQLSRPVGVFRKWIQAITIDRCKSLDSCCRLDHGLHLLQIYEGDDTYNRLWWSIATWVVKNLAVSFVCFWDRVNKTMAFESSVKVHPGFAWVKKSLDNFWCRKSLQELSTDIVIIHQFYSLTILVKGTRRICFIKERFDMFHNGWILWICQPLFDLWCLKKWCQ